jgi:hypothetical protein
METWFSKLTQKESLNWSNSTFPIKTCVPESLHFASKDVQAPDL